MSPNEFQLRNALRDGEGATPDADRLIAHATGVRRDRRRRLNTALASGAAVAVVGALATALVVTGSNDDSGGSGSNGGGMAAGAAAGPSTSAGSSAASSNGAAYSTNERGGVADGSAPQHSSMPAGASTATSCPSQPVQLMLPGGGGLGQYGSNETLIPDSVTSLRLCGYPLRASSGRTTALVDGAAARSIIDTLNAAPTTRTGVKPCPANVNSAAGTLEIIGITATGRTTKPVVLTINCPASQATNGTAVRYLNTLPNTLMQLVIPIPVDSPARSLPGKITVSPVR